MKNTVFCGFWIKKVKKHYENTVFLQQHFENLVFSQFLSFSVVLDPQPRSMQYGLRGKPEETQIPYWYLIRF